MQHKQTFFAGPPNSGVGTGTPTPCEDHAGEVNIQGSAASLSAHEQHETWLSPGDRKVVLTRGHSRAPSNKLRDATSLGFPGRCSSGMTDWVTRRTDWEGMGRLLAETNLLNVEGLHLQDQVLHWSASDLWGRKLLKVPKNS